MIAAVLMGVSWPWNLTGDAVFEAAGRLSGDSADVGSTIDSYSALLRFRERHDHDVAAARETFPELVDAYWFVWEDGLVAAMPTMADLTWTNFRRWASDFNSHDIGQSWDVPPEGFVEAAAWIWVNGTVVTSTTAATRWLIAQFERGQMERGLLTDFLEIATAYVGKVGDFAQSLVGIINHAGKRHSLPYLKRLAESADLTSEVRDSAARLYRWESSLDERSGER